MKPNEEECAICGKIDNRYWMELIVTGGKSSQYVCSECFRNGGRQADYATYRVGKSSGRENESK